MKGMYHSYKSDYPNQVHQLNCSVSQHYYILKNGLIRYQAKKFDINWNNYEKTGKRHIVNFLIRDHFSGCFYAEIFPIDEMPRIMDFLFNAWREKESYEFCGIPKNLILGKHILERFPEMIIFKENIGLNVEIAQNGFATGIRALRDWEHNIVFYTIYENYKSIYGFQKGIERICRDMNLRDNRKVEPNLMKWGMNSPQGTVMNNKNEFERLYKLGIKI